MSSEWRVQARRGIRWNGTLVVLTGMAAILSVYLKLPKLSSWISFPAFLLLGLNHLMAVWQLDRGGPHPECTTCRLPLNTSKYKCGACGKSYRAG